MAHHFANGLVNWKVRHSEGGGAMRFYGIHLIAVLASFGYRIPLRSVVSGEVPDHVEQWEATFSGIGLPEAEISVDTRSSSTCFNATVEAGTESKTLVDLCDPFPVAESDRASDRRIHVLKRLLGSLEYPDEGYAAAYDRVNLLWQDTEAITERH